MLEKLKTNLLWIVALLLGYSGWSRAQDPNEASALLEVPNALPMVSEDAVQVRKPGERITVEFDPFRIDENLDGRDRQNAVIDDGPRAKQGDEQDSGVPILSLDGVMRVDGKGVAWINQEYYNVGDTVSAGLDGASVLIKKIRGPKVTVEYLEEGYTLVLYITPRLSLGRKSGKLLEEAKSETAPGLIPELLSELEGSKPQG
jgi:hypothetical protein